MNTILLVLLAIFLLLCAVLAYAVGFLFTKYINYLEVAKDNAYRVRHLEARIEDLKSDSHNIDVLMKEVRTAFRTLHTTPKVVLEKAPKTAFVPFNSEEV
jgi:hypothetical protein